MLIQLEQDFEIYGIFMIYRTRLNHPYHSLKKKNIKRYLRQ